jgi:hypothetical protein
MLSERAEVLTLSNQRLASSSIRILDSEMEMHRASPSASLSQSTNLPTKVEKDHARLSQSLHMLAERSVRALELSALRQDELTPLVERLDDLDLRVFEYKTFHAPNLMDGEFESVAIKRPGQPARSRRPRRRPPSGRCPAPGSEGVVSRFGEVCVANIETPLTHSDPRFTMWS